ncbi:hypothetical protein P4159_09840 [Bacillus thuringiensis]|uniref:hypothetical protein n=1 Tax=Bacillus thuringiensis TaxID=1428 RepID=UPI0007C18D7E|nr:hypothetical protein [Bacillus thuringiensis]AND10424.1 hypothetical protein Bt4C1_25515 [Bacillus thuringiensis serovar alesti]MEC3596272.1 hypothetical protein [Bacillus thuringiensis]MED1832119.1 hypothetical protein [Bacillus thuringiensis]MED2031202.1 hypothetical protein [Bacillus thuringiensis]MED2208089.1 hypothetical protein [Bacillus thuringiensis]
MNNDGNNVVNLFMAIFALLALLFTAGIFLLSLIAHQEKAATNQQLPTVEVKQIQHIEKDKQ